MLEMKMLTQRFIHQLFLVIQGSIRLYLAVTEKLPNKNKEAAWEGYNESFDRKVIPQLLEVLERNGCGLPELCHATLKLMDIGARMVEQVETGDAGTNCEGEQIKFWFIPVH